VPQNRRDLFSWWGCSVWPAHDALTNQTGSKPFRPMRGDKRVAKAHTYGAGFGQSPLLEYPPGVAPCGAVTDE
jgi:hypothetical protein